MVNRDYNATGEGIGEVHRDKCEFYLAEDSCRFGGICYYPNGKNSYVHCNTRKRNLMSEEEKERIEAIRRTCELLGLKLTNL